ncbi:uncharacterized protein Tpl94D [Drosophila kikkawai]|uniref:Uncharacterized protein Tpl94D n=1 Tax=Drosophila kikkawai TaxID=30033 RepID=A0A6P4HW11_DROKI|nr:uncharacterized protein LOC108073344 [Drosophila kikkawai]
MKMGGTIGGQTNPLESIAAYNNFLCTYGLLHREGSLPSDAIQRATSMWCNFTPEQQMSFAYQPNDFEYEIRSECVQPLPKRGPEKKAMLKVKSPAAKCRTKKKATATASKRKQELNIPKRQNKACIRVKPSGMTLDELSKTGFQNFFKQLRERHSQITEAEIIKKAARAWCGMNKRQRQSFLR